ncbi:MAG: putative metal-binding motif-containing protein [Myxococcota bacterium]
MGWWWALAACDGRPEPAGPAPAPATVATPAPAPAPEPDTGPTDPCVDDDLDGVTVCAGDCDDADPAVFPSVPDGCGAADADCDHLPDAVAPGDWACGWCASPDDWLATPYAVTDALPCELDPPATLECPRPHQVVTRTDLPLRPTLVLFFPPGPGTRCDHVLAWIAHAGFPVIQVAFPDRVADAACLGSADPTCGGRVLEELLLGEDRGPEIDIPFDDGVVGRTAAVLAHLDQLQPEVGWGRFLIDGAPDWPSIVIAGWSDGGILASMAAKHLPIRATLLIAAPGGVGDGSVLTPWMTEPFVTPPEAMWAVRHVYDAQGAFMDAAWDQFGIAGPPTLFYTAPPPWATHRVLSDAPPTDGFCSAHGAIASDLCMDLRHAELYVPLMCEIAAQPAVVAP